MASDNHEDSSGFKVSDKRRFDEEGREREGADPAQDKDGGKNTSNAFPPHEIDFPTFVLSLATSAQVHLGVIPNPATGKQDSDPVLAKQTIDIIGILEEKTRGNLTEDEKKLLEHVLYDLRIQYLQHKK
ncbi:MAG TPA: DUF1844 domain-containing protein [bacterium]|nr:DUF1844 domain-containing protein [bacterium]